MKNIFLGLLVLILTTTVYAGDTTITKPTLYNPMANAAKQIDSIVAQAKKQNKHVLIQAGGNWCVWCLRFNKLTTEDPQLDSAIKANYIVYHLNYSKENMNAETFARLEFPQRFGFPVFIILDGKGKRIHTQNSAYLEQGKGYDKKKIMEFLNEWTPKALSPETYKAKK